MRLRSRLTVRRQDTKGDEMMTEERATYATDEVTQLRRQVAQLVDRLDAAFKTIDGFTDASSFQWAEYQRRIAELEADIARKNGAIHALDHLAAQLTAQLAAVPVDALRRYYRGTVYTPTAAQRYDYMPDDYDTDSIAIHRWLFPKDGAA